MPDRACSREGKHREHVWGERSEFICWGVPPEPPPAVPDPPRAVWMTKDKDVRLLQRCAQHALAGVPIETGDANALMVLADRWFSATPDAEGAVRYALTTPGEAYPELVLGPILADALVPEVLRMLRKP